VALCRTDRDKPVEGSGLSRCLPSPVGLAGDDAPNGRASVPLVNDEMTVMTLSADDEIESLRALLHAAADNEVITSLINTASIFGWALRLRAVQAMHDTPEVGLSRIREHREIVTALRARDADRVETLMRRHLTTGIEYVLKQAR
jgi:DNA-binding FadR family transcriptional regulator